MIGTLRTMLIRRILVTIGIGLVIILLSSFGLRLFEAVSSLRSAPHDNVQWTLAQLEVELLTLMNSTLSNNQKTVELDELRKRFDVFYSRATTLTRGKVFAELRTTPKAAPAVRELTNFLTRTTPLIDGPDQQLTLALPTLRNELEALRPAVRELSITGVFVFAKLADARRIAFEKLLLSASLVAVGLIVLLAITLAFLYRQFRISKERSKAVYRSSQRQIATINASLDAIVVINEQGEIIDINEAATEVFGYSRDQALGADMADLMVPQQYMDAHLKGMKRHRQNGEKKVVGKGRVELSALRADRTEFPIELSIGEAADKSGTIFIAYIRDISSRIVVENELTEARDKALQGERAKGEFIAVMSHEMRTPLNGLLGVLDLLRQTELNGRQRQYLDIANSSGQILLQHVNDVLDLSRMETGKVRLASDPLDLGTIVSGVVDLNRPVAQANGVRLVSTIMAPQAVLAGDTHRIRQVLMNLVGNAVKFTQEGQITITVDILKEDDFGAEIDMRVKDTGIGIAADDQARIFGDFVTIDPTYNRKVSGSGLGLAICQRIVRAMGGEISLESTPGLGSCFSFRFKLPHWGTGVYEDSSPKRLKPDSTAVIESLDILLVEDNEINRFVAREMLQRAGHGVTEATNGLEGVDRAQARTFDLILMDISMPGMDGIEATKTIRSGGGPCRDTTIIGLTAHALPEEQKRFKQAGMQYCLTKPIRIETLQDILIKVNARSATDTSVEARDDEDEVMLDGNLLRELASSLKPGMFEKVVTNACLEFEKGLPDLSAAWERGELQALALLAHKLAGSAAIVGATGFHVKLAAIEIACTSDAPRLEADLRSLDNLSQATIRALRSFVGSTPQS